MSQVRQIRLSANGINIAAALAGSGPLIVLIHGFPESSRSWRHQIPAFAQHGYQVCAIDVRGYGDTDRPHQVNAYAMREMVADIDEVIAALSPQQPAIVIGHDWGAPIAWHTALVYPQRVRAVAGLSVPFMGIPPRPLDEMLHERYTQRSRFHYQVYFAEEGRAEMEFESNVRSALRRLYYSVSGDAPPGLWANKPFGGRLLDGLPDPDPFPTWLSADELDQLVAIYERTGFRGALNRYRNYQTDFAFLTSYRGRKLQQPCVYIGGTRDLVLSMIPDGDPGAAMRAHAADVRGVHMLAGCGHWTQQERSAEVTQLLIDWLDDVDRD